MRDRHFSEDSCTDLAKAVIYVLKRIDRRNDRIFSQVIQISILGACSSLASSLNFIQRSPHTHFIDYSSMTVAGEVFTLDESLPRGRSSWWTEHSNFRTDVSDEARGRRRPREGENLTAIKIRIALETSRRSTRRRSSSLSLSPSLLAPSCTRRVGVPFRDLRRFNRAINLTPCCNNTSRRAAVGK